MSACFEKRTQPEKAIDFDEAMILAESQACELGSGPGATAIIATYNSNPKLFAFVVLSLFANSEDLEHLIVVINGPDSRTGSTATQDVKQAFLEAIRNEKLGDRAMPLTVLRVWSRLGHGQALDSAIPWVTTKHYLIMHDDVLVLSERWMGEAQKLLSNPQVAIAYAERPHILQGISRSGNAEKAGITFPHANTSFMMCRRSSVVDLRWAGYFVDKEYPLIKLDATKEFFQKHNGYGVAHTSLEVPQSPEFLSYDIGSYLLATLQHRGFKFSKLPEGMIYHLGGISWVDKPHVRERQWKVIEPFVASLEDRIKSRHRNLFDIYLSFFSRDHLLWDGRYGTDNPVASGTEA
jgi:hypothetical protein